MSKRSGHAEVVGAGIAGLTAAAALAQRGWSVRVHERENDIRAIGSGIYLWGNGLDVLRELGVHEWATTGAHVGTSLETRDHRDTVIGSLPINGTGDPQVLTILRERLVDSLLHAVSREGVEVVLGSTVTGASETGEVKWADGTSARADLVIVADGVNSRLREHLGLLRRHRRLGQVCTRLLVSRQPGYVVAEDEAKYIEFYSGNRFVLYTPSSAEQLYVALVCPRTDQAGRTFPTDKGTWIRSFPHLQNLIEHLDGQLRWDEFDCVELRSWSTGRIAVLGDAAHAQPPYLGQGGGCAMMNALGLAHSVTHTSGSLPARLHAWESTERPIIQHTQRFSYRVGQLNSLPNGPRSVLVPMLNRIGVFGRSRVRAATTRPTGCTS